MRNGQLLCGFLIGAMLTGSTNLSHGAEAVASAPDSSKEITVTEQDASPIWADGFGSGFRSGTINVGVAIGGAMGMEILGSNDRHDLVLAVIQYGHIVSRHLAPDSWYGGNFELGADLAAGSQVHPHKAYVLGLMPSVRYHFGTGTAWVPFIEAGAGPGITDIGLPDLSTKFQFMDYFGGGVNWFYNDSDLLSLGVRFIHLSNASIKDPNFGVNTGMLFVGWKRFF